MGGSARFRTIQFDLGVQARPSSKFTSFLTVLRADDSENIGRIHASIPNHQRSDKNHVRLDDIG